MSENGVRADCDVNDPPPGENPFRFWPTAEVAALADGHYHREGPVLPKPSIQANLDIKEPGVSMSIEIS